MWTTFLPHTACCSAVAGGALSRKSRGVAIFGSVSLIVANERCVVKAHAATERGVSSGCIWLIQ